MRHCTPTIHLGTTSLQVLPILHLGLSKVTDTQGHLSWTFNFRSDPFFLSRIPNNRVTEFPQK